MKKLILLVLAAVCVFISGNNAYSYCDPGAPAISNAAPAIAGSPECMERINSSFNRGETMTRSVYLSKGETYSAAATGCPRAGTIEISVLKNGSIIASSSDYAPRFCFRAPEDGDYTFKVQLKTTLHDSSWGNVNACFYKSTDC